MDCVTTWADRNGKSQPSYAIVPLITKDIVQERGSF